MLHVQFIVQFSQDQDLWPPVLGVRRAVFQAEQGEPGSRESQAADTVTPLLLSSEEEHYQSCFVDQNLKSKKVPVRFLKFSISVGSFPLGKFAMRTGNNWVKKRNFSFVKLQKIKNVLSNRDGKRFRIFRIERDLQISLLCLPLEFNIFINDEGDSNSDQSKVPTRHEHDGDTADGPED